jgi:tRNA (cytidine/uridine-2'-O-)-methyltransferase
MSIAKAMTLPQSSPELPRGLRLALFQPDIPQNAGTMMRLAACLDIGVDLIEPAGFPTGDRHFRRAGMDYLDAVDLRRHISWAAFDAMRREEKRRLVLLTTKAALNYLEAGFRAGDTLLVGRESSGAPDEVHRAADLSVRIPMRPALRSLNVAVSAALVLGEAMRQTGGFSRL